LRLVRAGGYDAAVAAGEDHYFGHFGFGIEPGLATG